MTVPEFPGLFVFVAIVLAIAWAPYLAFLVLWWATKARRRSLWRNHETAEDCRLADLRGRLWMDDGTPRPGFSWYTGEAD